MVFSTAAAAPPPCTLYRIKQRAFERSVVLWQWRGWDVCCSALGGKMTQRLVSTHQGGISLTCLKCWLTLFGELATRIECTFFSFLVIIREFLHDLHTSERLHAKLFLYFHRIAFKSCRQGKYSEHYKQNIICNRKNNNLILLLFTLL